ncbi:MAG: PilT/PilU family type 4a pilus ATPase [Candidatus Omnitrophica bacterium]|nr:PilT/PilU family type 4a pilus ATPase [Candidatus Omnitrophota bacterium]
MFQNQPINRRRSFRVYTRIPLVYEILSGQERERKRKNGIIKNISSEGMGIELELEIDEALSIDTDMKISFTLPKLSRSIAGRIKIAWVRAIPIKRTFFAGAIFTEINDRDKQDITKLIEHLSINKILDQAIDAKASDIHLVVDQPPVFRINGELHITEMPSLLPEDIVSLVYSMMEEEQISAFEKNRELDFGFQYNLNNRFRANLHQQKGFLEVALRLITARQFSFEELRIPKIVKDLSRQKDGLVLIVGPAGSGKTTTIAAMIDQINHEKSSVVITLERPIEYIHSNIKSIVKQREVGLDTDTFSGALKSSLRQDPNVIVVGELDDIETIKTALVAAEAGYLVIASFHAPNTIQAIDRLAGMFPAESRRQILAQLANCVRGIISQLLIPKKNKKERVLACEVIIGSEATKTIIRKDELIQLPTIIQTGGAYHMQTMYDSIRRYLDEGIIDEETALLYSEEFSQYKQWIK